jgi:hypothetical protein
MGPPFLVIVAEALPRVSVDTAVDIGLALSEGLKYEGQHQHSDTGDGPADQQRSRRGAQRHLRHRVTSGAALVVFRTLATCPAKNGSCGYRTATSVELLAMMKHQPGSTGDDTPPAVLPAFTATSR